MAAWNAAATCNRRTPPGRRHDRARLRACVRSLKRVYEDRSRASPATASRATLRVLLLVYVSCWIKHHHGRIPGGHAQQPTLGFLHPSQLARTRKRATGWRCGRWTLHSTTGTAARENHRPFGLSSHPFRAEPVEAPPSEGLTPLPLGGGWSEGARAHQAGCPPGPALVSRPQSRICNAWPNARAQPRVHHHQDRPPRQPRPTPD
jgi:hypothetical protein